MFNAAHALKQNKLTQDCWTTDGKIFIGDARARIKIFSDWRPFETWLKNLEENPPVSYADITGLRPK